MPRPGHFTLGKDPVPIVQEGGWAPGPAWTGAEILAPTGIQTPGRPARSQSLYRLHYRCPLFWYISISLFFQVDFSKMFSSPKSCTHCLYPSNKAHFQTIILLLRRHGSPLASWDFGFNSGQKHGYLSLVNIVCCQIEASADPSSKGDLSRVYSINCNQVQQ